ncbi:MAG: hypothetical protein ACOZNI_02370 [Myxococcota bacterium]
MLIALLACKEPEVITLGGRETSLDVTLVNPTSCDVCDPFRNVDTLRLDVIAGGEVVASDSFAWPGETPELPDLEGFGVVRIALVGLSGSRVASAGRTAEVVLVPDRAQTATMVFLPANRALPLAGGMLGDRSHALAARLRDGRVLVAGGVDPMRDRTFANAETYDPATGTFSPTEATLPEDVAAPVAAWTAEGDLLVTGGWQVEGPTTPASAAASRYDADEERFVPLGDMAQARAGHCLAIYRERHAIVLGGAADTNQADYAKRDDDTGEWAFSAIGMRDFEPADVSGCAPISEERVFVQGRTLDATGVWSYADGGDPAESFRSVEQADDDGARALDGPMLLPLPLGDVWVGSGADAGTGEAVEASRIFDAGHFRFDESGPLAVPRVDGKVEPWIAEGWLVAGCGFEDAARTSAASSVELFDWENGSTAVTVDLDRTRPGCAATVLADGSVLVTGGFGEDDAGADAASLVVPWAD